MQKKEAVFMFGFNSLLTGEHHWFRINQASSKGDASEQCFDLAFLQKRQYRSIYQEDAFG